MILLSRLKAMLVRCVDVFTQLITLRTFVALVFLSLKLAFFSL